MRPLDVTFQLEPLLFAFCIGVATIFLAYYVNRHIANQLSKRKKIKWIAFSSLTVSLGYWTVDMAANLAYHVPLELFFLIQAMLKAYAFGTVVSFAAYVVIHLLPKNYTTFFISVTLLTLATSLQHFFNLTSYTPVYGLLERTVIGGSMMFIWLTFATTVYMATFQQKWRWQVYWHISVSIGLSVVFLIVHFMSMAEIKFYPIVNEVVNERTTIEESTLFSILWLNLFIVIVALVVVLFVARNRPLLPALRGIDFHSTVDAILLVDEHGMIVISNQKANELLQIRARGLHIQLVFADIDYRSMSVERIVYPYVYQDRPPRQLELSFVQLMALHKVEYLLVIRDVTAQLKAQTLLRESNEKYRLLFNATPLPLVVHDEAKILSANDSWVELLHQFDRSFIEGISFVSFFTAEQYEHFIEFLKEVAATFEAKKTIQVFRQWTFELTTSAFADDGDIKFQTVIRDITAEVTLKDEMERMAYSDALTNLPNRRSLPISFAERSQQLLPSQQMAVLFIDLDKFKQANDQHGHAIGDVVLQQVAERFNAVLIERGQLFRFGGDEFVGLFVYDHREQIHRLSQQLLTVIREPIIIDELQIELSASIGVASYPTDGTEIDELINVADQLMYKVKQSGKNNVQFYEKPNVQ